MDAYANIDDLESRWKALGVDEQKKAEALLLDASYHLKALLEKKRGEDFEIDDVLAHNLKVVVCNIVMRSMNTRPDLFGVSQMSITADVYSQSFTPINSTGDMRLTDEEAKLLGLKSAKVGFVHQTFKEK